MTKNLSNFTVGATLLLATTLSVGPAGALDHCNARINPGLGGTIQIYAQNVSGALLWGNSSGAETYQFHNAATCVTGSPLVATACELGARRSALAITPPPQCTLYLKDGGGTCSVFIRNCTPGTRPLVELPHRYVDNHDGTVTDTKTGLMWEQMTDTPCDANNPECYTNSYTWSTNAPFADGTAFTDLLLRVNGFLCSANTCSGLAGHSDWRLPTIGELLTLVDKTVHTCGYPASPGCINPVFSPTDASRPFWSSSTLDGTPDAAWYVNFGDGTASSSGKYSYSYVRAVRGGL